VIKSEPLLIEKESHRILIPRNVEGRKEKLKRIHWRRVLKYIKNGCRGDLDLRKTPLEFLPNDLTSVGGYLDLSYSKIKKLPDKLEKIGESLFLSNTLIEFLPNNLIVNGCLYLSCSRIKKLPDNLKIGESLFLDVTSIEFIPENLSIGMDLSIYGTPLSKKYTKDEIRKMVKHIERNIYK
jgi:hypothetical protein